MKKIIVVLLFMLCIVGCQKEKKEMLMNKTYTVDESVQVEIIKTMTSYTIQPSNKNQQQKRKIQAKEQYVFADVLLRLNNISNSQKYLQDIFNGYFEIDKEIYKLQMILETENYTQLTQTDTIKAGQERYAHLYCEIPQKQMDQDIQLHLNILGQQNEYHFVVGKVIEQKQKTHSIGDVLSLDMSQITINQMSQSKKIEPSCKGLFYSYIPTDNKDETFVYLQVDIHNISKSSINLNNYLYCEYIVQDQTSSSRIIVESDNHKSLKEDISITPEQTRTVYLAIPIKDQLLKSKGVFQLFIEGQIFQVAYE